MEATLRAFLNIFPEKMKKRTIWYLFDRYLGHFLREKLTLDQLSIDLIDGKGCINELDLDVDALNEEFSFLPVKFIDGCFIDEISVYVPWSFLLTESCSLQINGATVICQLDGQVEGKSLIESDYLTRSIMTSSMKIAEEIVHENQEEKFEGLEIFAQLIDSVLRRIELIATDVSFILRSRRSESRNPVNRGSSPSTEEDYCDLEIKVKHLRCEENCNKEEEANCEKDDVSVAPKTITKKLTIEDIEIFMDGDRICTLKDKHVMEVNVEDSRCDIQVYLASILTTILKKNQITELINMTNSKESGSTEGFHSKGEKIMSALDYARVEQQLKLDAARCQLGSSRNNLNATLLGGVGGVSNAWTSSNDAYESCDGNYLPLDYSKNSLKSDKKDTKSFSCAIKLPGLALCLVDSSYSGDASQIDPKASTLNEINAALDEQVTCDHIRLITMPIQIEIRSAGCSIVSGDIWIAEKNQRGLCPYVWTEPREHDLESESSSFLNHLSSYRPQSPSRQKVSFQCIINNEKIELSSVNLTNCIIDPTLLERVHKYFPSLSGSNEGSSSSDFLFSVVCPEVKGRLMIPVADLRSEEKPAHSELRPFWLEFEGSSLDFTTNLTSYDITLNHFILALADSQGTKEIGRMTSEGSTPVRLSIKKGADASTILEPAMVQTALQKATMTESIFICATHQAPPDSPFQTKTQIIRPKSEDDAKTFLPNNISNSQTYFETCKSFTQLQIEISADKVDIYIDEKEQIDLLYNALGNDLALWTPITYSNFKGLKDHPDTTPKLQSYFSCGSGMAESIESDSSFHSVDRTSTNQNFHNLVTCILRCDTLNVAIGDHSILSSSVFIGLSFGLQDDTSNIVSIHGTKVSWSYLNESMISGNYFCNKPSSLDLTFEINTKELPVSKRIKVAALLSEAIVFKTTPDIFIDFWKFVDVTNEPVLGYKPPKILTELHISLVNGAISYGTENYPPPPRPVIITFDGICVTAMVVEDTSDTLMRFIVEEAAFFFKKNSLSNKCLRNYVCVIDSGLIDMHLKLSENNKIEFRAINNIINVRACNDSLAALCQFIITLVNENSDPRSDDDLPSYSKAVNVPMNRKGSNNSELIREVLLNELGKNMRLQQQQQPQETLETGAEERISKKENESSRKKEEKGKRKEGGKKKSREEDKGRKEDSSKRKESYEKKKNESRKSREEKERGDRLTEKMNLKDRIMSAIDNPGPSASSATGLRKGEMTESGFWLLGDDDIGAGIKATDEPIVRQLTDGPIVIYDNFFSPGKSKEPSELMKQNIARYFLEEMSLIVSVFGGRDFEDDKGGADESDLKEDRKDGGLDIDFRNREIKVRFNADLPEDDSVHLWESINLEEGSDFATASASRPTVSFSQNTKSSGGRFRKSNICVQLYLTRVRVVFDKFSEICPTAWRFSFFVKEIEIRDRLQMSNINKMLYEYISEDLPRRSSSSMISIRAKAFRNTVDSHEECDLRISLKPLRVNIDQDTIIFLVDYFTSLKVLMETTDKTSRSSSSSGSTTPSPVYAGSERDLNCSSNAFFLDENETPLSAVITSDDTVSSKPSSLFVKSFEFSPTVPIRLDYHGKRFDFEQGTLPGLLMGLAHLNQSDLHLKRLLQKRGILGVDRVIQYALMEWFDDIKKNQIPSILGAIGPMNSVRQLIQGIVDLFWIPVDQYRRDRRIVRGIQKGASSFSSSTATAVLDLANRLVHVIQGTAQFAHDVVLTQNRSPQHNIRGSVPKIQPRDLREGVASAYTVMREGLNETYRNVANAGAQADGVTETVGALIGTLPSNILQPIIKASEATSNVIVGMRNQLTPEARKDDQYKWK